MPLVNPHSLTRMVGSHERATGRAARRIADAGTDRMEREIVRRTPIDTNPFRYRPGRPRGTARGSIHRLPGLREQHRWGRTQYVGDVKGSDPILRYIEFDTPPHIIRARAPGGRLHFQSRHGWTNDDGVHFPPGTWVTIEEVHHPGTKGQHMFSLGALDAERAIDAIARSPLVQWKREVEGFLARP